MGLKIDFYRDDPQLHMNEVIRSARRAMGYTQGYVAECIRMSVRQYMKYENGQLDIADISFQQGINLCELLHIEIYELVTPIEALMENKIRGSTG